MPRYFRLNSLKQTMMEDLRIVRSWKVVFLWLAKVVRHRLRFTSPIPLPVPFESFQVAPEAVPAWAVEKLLDPLREASELGFFPPTYQVVPTLRGESVSVCATLRHEGCETVLRLMCVRVGMVHPPQTRIVHILYTGLGDGRTFITSEQRQMYNPAPHSVVQRCIKAPLPVLVTAHQRRLETLRTAHALERVNSDLEAARFIDRFEQQSMDYNVSRGLYEEVPADEVARESVASQVVDPEVAAVASDGATVEPGELELLKEIRNAQTKRGSWVGAMVIGLLSFVAFIAAGGVRWNWEVGVILTAVVLFHEFGHYVAMRCFKYRDLRMFFIPLLGAAVTGRHFNVKGWQQAMVYLAGPVPGIVVGIGLGVAALYHPEVEWLRKTALMALILNGINLLPFLPLDGGWILNTVVFSRNYIVESVFQCFAALGLIAATALGQGRLWAALGIGILISLPTTFRLARLTRQLRRSGLDWRSADGKEVPLAAALAISREVKTVLPGTHHLKILATHTLTVFQRLNAVPPGGVVTAVLLAVYLGSMVAAFLGIGMIFAGREGLLGVGANSFLTEPQCRADAPLIEPRGVEVEVRRLSTYRDPCLVLTLSNSVDAALVDRVAGILGPGERVRGFGQTLFVSGERVGKERLPSLGLGARCTNAFLEVPLSNNCASVSLVCRGPDAARAAELAKELEAYFSGASLHLWPPWLAPTNRPLDQQETIARRVHTWRLLDGLEAVAANDPETKKLEVATRRRFPFPTRSRAERSAAFEAYHVARGRAYEREVNRLRESKAKDPLLDTEMLEAYVRVNESSKTTNYVATAEARKELERRVECVSFEGSLPVEAEGWRGAIFGSASVRGPTLSCVFVLFRRTEEGLPLLADYLRQKGCTDLRYSLFHGDPGAEDSEDNEVPPSKANTR